MARADDKLETRHRTPPPTPSSFCSVPKTVTAVEQQTGERDRSVWREVKLQAAADQQLQHLSASFSSPVQESAGLQYGSCVDAFCATIGWCFLVPRCLCLNATEKAWRTSRLPLSRSYYNPQTVTQTITETPQKFGGARLRPGEGARRRRLHQKGGCTKPHDPR